MGYNPPWGIGVAFSLKSEKIMLEVVIMAHLTLSDRIKIESGLNAGKTINQIADEVGKHRSTISREIRSHITAVDKGAAYRVKNRCVLRTSCERHYLCEDKPNCTRKCSTCAKCNNCCPDFLEEKCSLLNTAPYACNGCEKQSACVLMKAYYRANAADAKYRETLSQARQGYNMVMSELRQVDEIVSPLLKQGQSIYHISVTHADELPVSASTISRLVKDRQLTATVLDQQRVVKLKPRKTQRPAKKVDRKCRAGRTIEDYNTYMAEHPDASEVQSDTVIGKVGGKSLLTIIFPKNALMLAFLCDYHTAACVNAKFEYLYEHLGEAFPRLFQVILTDNGSEFSNPAAIETAPDGSMRAKVFYCDPMSSWQKAQVERNHEFIRQILPKGSSFDHLTQEKVGLMMSHINSYKRRSLGDRSPFELFAFMYGEELLERLLRLTCQTIIPPSDIILKPSLLR